MTAAPNSSTFSNSQQVPSKQGHHRSNELEKSFRKSGSAISPEDAEREWFAGLLWKAFPEATSENELADLAAEILTTEKRPVTARAVKNWLRKMNSPHFRYVIRIIALAGIENIFQIIDPEIRE